MSEGYVDLVQAAEGLREGQAMLAVEKPRKALPPLVRALEALRGGCQSDPEALRLLQTVSSAFERACAAAGRSDLLQEWSEAIFDAGLRRGPLAEQLVRRWALEERRTDSRALSAYVAYLEARGRLDDTLRLRLNQILSYGLHVRLSSTPEQLRPIIPILQRLHRIRPRMAFPRLYLGRHHYLKHDYAEARKLLQDLPGRLGDSPKVLNVRGRSAEKLGLFDEALRLYRQSLAVDRHQPHVHFRAGRVLLWQYQGR